MSAEPFDKGKILEMNEDIKKAKELVDTLAKNFKAQQGTTWEIHLEDGTLYKRGEQTACFAATIQSLKACVDAGLKPKTITYYVEEGHVKENLTPLERKQWFLLLKRVGVIKNKKAAAKLVEGGISYDVTDASLSPCALYLELALCRYINEEPAVVKSVFALMKAGVGFAQALAYSQSKHGRSGGHMVLPFTGGIYNEAAPAQSLGQVLTLNTFIKNRETMDDRKVVEHVKGHGPYGYWEFHQRLGKQNSAIKLKDMANFLSDEMVELFNCETPEEIATKVEESKKKGDSIFV